jgi:hypothetical protein
MYILITFLTGPHGGHALFTIGGFESEEELRDFAKNQGIVKFEYDYAVDKESFKESKVWKEWSDRFQRSV